MFGYIVGNVSSDKAAIGGAREISILRLICGFGQCRVTQKPPSRSNTLTDAGAGG
jgi:hypothetical protein